MSEEKLAAFGIFAVTLFAIMLVFLISRTCDSIDNCMRSCNGQMAKYTEAPALGTSSKIPVCECAPAEQR